MRKLYNKINGGCDINLCIHISDMIPRAIWTSLKKDDGGQDGEEAPRKPLPLPRERRAKEEKRGSSKPSKESDISREEAKTDLVRLSRMEDREEASKLGMSVDDWLAGSAGMKM